MAESQATARKAQTIEQVAALIHGASLTADEATERNEGDGWTFQVRWADSGYVSGSDYTQAEGYRLGDEDMAAAIAMAARWEAGDFGPEAY